MSNPFITALANQIVGYGMLATVIIGILLIVYFYVIPAIVEWWNGLFSDLKGAVSELVPYVCDVIDIGKGLSKEIIDDVEKEGKKIIDKVEKEGKKIIDKVEKGGKKVVDKVGKGAKNIVDDANKNIKAVVEDPLKALTAPNGIIDSKYIPELAYCPSGSTNNRSKEMVLARSARMASMILPTTTVPLLAPLIAVFLNSKVEKCHTCPSGYGYDPLTSKCIKYCPEGSKDTGQYCLRDRKYSTVGTDGAMKLVCPKDTVEHAGLCYSVPKDWEIASPGLIAKKCSTVLSGYTGQSLTKCRIEPASYTRDFISEKKCKETVKNDGLCKKRGVRWYIDDCKALALEKGHGNSASQFKVVLDKCKRSEVSKDRPHKSQTGKAKQLMCPVDKEKHGALCYPKCPSGYYRSPADLEYCSAKCPTGFTDIGIGGCKKPSVKDTTQMLSDVGVCSDTTRPHKQGALCLNDMQKNAISHLIKK